MRGIRSATRTSYRRVSVLIGSSSRLRSMSPFPHSLPTANTWVVKVAPIFSGGRNLTDSVDAATIGRRQKCKRRLAGLDAPLFVYWIRVLAYRPLKPRVRNTVRWGVAPIHSRPMDRAVKADRGAQPVASMGKHPSWYASTAYAALAVSHSGGLFSFRRQ